MAPLQQQQMRDTGPSMSPPPSPQQPSSSETYLFAEADEAFRCVEAISRLQYQQHETGDESKAAAATTAEATYASSSLKRLRSIFDKYLECPSLLDPALERLVSCLAQTMLQVLRKRHLEQQRRRQQLQQEEDDNEAPVQQRQLQQEDLPGQIRFALSALYALSKVRGRKVVQRFLPRGVDDVEPVWSALLDATSEHVDGDSGTKSRGDFNSDQYESVAPRWESVYMLWNWMGALSLVPFGCGTVLGNGEDGDAASSEVGTIMRRQAGPALAEAGPVRDAAASCLASWLSRPDWEDTELPQFVRSTVDRVIAATVRGDGLHPGSGGGGSNQHLFELMGAMQTVTAVLKQSPIARQRLIETMNPIWEPILELSTLPVANNNLVLRKLLVKWWTRMSCTYLPPRIASWRYQRGKRVLTTAKATTAAAQSSASKISSLCNAGEDAEASYRDELFPVPEQVEDAVGRLIEALGHTSTMVRWSAAKGIGRITERLPETCAEDVLDAVLEYFEDKQKDNQWHGACLALAELARRGLLLVNRLDDVVPYVIEAVQYDVQRGHKSVGAHVRDAACYAYWAFSRAYSPQVLRPFMKGLSEAIVITSLFDREVNCRRAASAAFQEAVGRQGATNFPHGISILTAADYFSLGNRQDSYMSISMHVASFGEYRMPILRHLYRTKMFHWDPTIRKLTSKSLSALTTLDPKFVGGIVMPFLMDKSLDPTNLNVRHGAVLGVAETVLALSKLKQLDALSETSKTFLAELVPAIEKKRLYRGRGGEIMRSAVCRLVECISIAGIALSVPAQVKLLDSLDASIPHPSELIQTRACLALHELMSTYFPVRENGPTSRLQSRVVDKFVRLANTSVNPAAARGYALALGYLPPKLVAPNTAVLEAIVKCLRRIARYDSLVGGESDAETRRNALLSLARIMNAVGSFRRESEKFPVAALDSETIAYVFETFLFALDDYKTDRRGDVGSWCRMVAMDGIVSLVSIAAATDTDLYNTALPTRIIAVLLKQLSEKLDTIRQKAGESLQLILLNNGVIISERIPFKAELTSLIRYESDIELHYRSWAEPSFTFPIVLRAASLGEDSYFDNVVAGIVISIGCLTESVSKAAKASLLEWISGQRKAGVAVIGSLYNRLSSLLDEHIRQARVMLPILTTLNFLFLNRCQDKAMESAASDFSPRLLRSLVSISGTSDDIRCLLAGIDVAVGLALLAKDTDSARMSASFLCTMLLHRFPRVRSHAAEQLYVVVLERSDLLHDDESAIDDIILNTPWASDLQALKAVSEQVASSLGVAPDPCEIPCNVGAK